MECARTQKQSVDASPADVSTTDQNWMYYNWLLHCKFSTGFQTDFDSRPLTAILSPYFWKTKAKIQHIAFSQPAPQDYRCRVKFFASMYTNYSKTINYGCWTT